MKRYLIIGFSGSGKTTAADTLASMTGGTVANESDYIILDYAQSANLDPEYVKAHKPVLRQDLYDFARKKQAEDPTYPVKLTQRHGANIVTGTRNPDELVAKRHMYDLIIWIERSGCPPGPTDKLAAEDADIIVLNNGTIEDLREALKVAVETARP